MAESPLLQFRVTQDVYDALEKQVPDAGKSAGDVARNILAKALKIKEKAKVKKVGRPTISKKSSKL